MTPNSKAPLPFPFRGAPQDAHRLALSAVLNIVCVGGGLLIGALLVAQILPAADDFFFYKTVGIYLLVLLPLLAFLQRHQPHTRFGSANTVTLIRAAIVCLLASLYGEQWNAIGLLVTCAAIVALSLDGVDGWLARRRGTQSHFGARFDMETDALLVLVLSLLAWESGQAGAWVLTAGLMRYAFVGAAIVQPWLDRPLPESRRRKTICVLQLIALIACVAPILPDGVRTLSALLAVVMVSGSFAVDIAWLVRRRPGFSPVGTRDAASRGPAADTRQ
jgi:phosphatidylglycerophosphate synthase